MPSDRVPLLGAMWSGAMVRCHRWMPLLGAIVGCGRVSFLDAMVRCHCWVPCGRVPLVGAIAGCHLIECHCDAFSQVPW